jgi:hypothetical protein
VKISLNKEIASRQDLTSVILELRTYREWFSKMAIKHKSGSKSMVMPPKLSKPALDLINQQRESRPVSQNLLDSLINELEKLESSSEFIVITLGALPSTNINLLLINWCRQNLNPNILVDFRFNSTMLGGMAVQYGSHIYDWSFKRQIMASLNKFPEVLRRV